ncbi:acyl-CoA carboxylase subunit epsilon [Actinobacteria bacterium IMCC26103]|nr:acyl-CoA carboxylase subunit epsilon [Actinobacteria bacterium IMCC26103]
MKFTVTSGNATDEELLALKAALDQHKLQNLTPVIKRSVFGLPQLRQPLPHQITFGARRKSK